MNCYFAVDKLNAFFPPVFLADSFGVISDGAIGVYMQALIFSNFFPKTAPTIQANSHGSSPRPMPNLNKSVIR